MKRYRQTFDEISSALEPIDAAWRDEHADQVIRLLEDLPARETYTDEDIASLLRKDFRTAVTAFRLFLDLSKDEFQHRIAEELGAGGSGAKRFAADPAAFVSALGNLGLHEQMTVVVSRPLHWSDTLVERLKGGRGSAIKGQARGRDLEDFVERIAMEIFDPGKVAVRKRFTGALGSSTEKADFAMPSAEDPAILIEVKAYGATGSKQTDVLGDIARIVAEKRPDTALLLVTDGITWRQRASDLKKLIALQNEGKILRIYTKRMAGELRQDLISLRSEFDL